MSRCHGIVLGVVGDFANWQPVPYLVEDPSSGRRLVWPSPKKGFLVGFSTELVLVMYAIYKLGCDAVDVVLLIPSTLLTGRVAQNEKNKGLYDLYTRIKSVASLGKVSLKEDEIRHAVLEALGNKIEEFLDKVKGGSCAHIWDVESQVRFYKAFLELVQKSIGVGNANERLLIEDRAASMRLYPVVAPIALTSVVKACEEKTKCGDNVIVTYRVSDAAEKLTGYISMVLSALISDALEELIGSSDKNRLVIISDLSHGVNYTSASLLHALATLQYWLQGILAVKRPWNIDISMYIYNSDPVMPPTLAIGRDNEAYKIHLVSYYDLEPVPVQEVAYSLLTSANTLHDLSMRGQLANILKQSNLLGKEDETRELAQLVIGSLLLGLPFQTVLYYSNLQEKLSKTRCTKNLPSCEYEVARSQSFTITCKAVKERTVNCNLGDTDKLLSYKNAALLLVLDVAREIYASLVEKAAKGLRLSIDSIQDCTDMISNALEKYSIQLINHRWNEIISKHNISRCLVIELNTSERDELEATFSWLSEPSRTILIDELLSQLGKEIKPEWLKPILSGNIGIDYRNLIAHAGLSRGIAAPLPGKDKTTIIVLESNELSSAIKNLINKITIP